MQLGWAWIVRSPSILEAVTVLIGTHPGDGWWEGLVDFGETP